MWCSSLRSKGQGTHPFNQIHVLRLLLHFVRKESSLFWRIRVSFEGLSTHFFSAFFHREVMGSFSVQWLPNPNPNSPTTPTPYVQRLAPPASFGPSVLCIQLPAKKCTRDDKLKGKNLQCLKCKIFLLFLEEEDNWDAGEMNVSRKENDEEEKGFSRAFWIYKVNN